MGNTILHSFLDHQFIKTDDVEHITKLSKASSAIEKMLSIKKNKSKIINFTLVALDPTISDKDPIIKEVEQLIIKHWPTFRNSVVKTKDTPVAYIQAVILQSLLSMSDDKNIAAVIWHTGCNILSHFKLAGQEKVLTDFLLDIGKKVEKTARDEWSIIQNIQINTIDPIEIPLQSITKGAISEAKLKSRLLAAAVHQGWSAQAGGGENPYTQVQNNWNWPQFFAESAAAGISKEINLALTSQNKSLNDIANTINETLRVYFSQIEPHLEELFSNILQSSQSLNKRSGLIWWKQTLYSTKLDKSYRSLNLFPLAIAMASDLSDIVSPIYPKMVDFFLKEALWDVVGEKINDQLTMNELFEQLEQLDDNAKLLFNSTNNENEYRKPLVDCMEKVVMGEASPKDFVQQSGLSGSTKLSIGELSVWLFHGIQANKLVNMK